MAENTKDKEDLKDTASAEAANRADAETQATEEQEKTQDEVATQDEKSAEEVEKELQAQVAALKDQLLRQMAEFDNYRKRTMKEKAELILNGGQKVLESLLPVLDDLERAQSNMKNADNIDTLKEGVELIITKMMKVLSGHGLKKMETENAEFNTDFHEAIALIPAPTEEQKNHVIDCVQAGYLLNDKVIRHAKVAVGQ